VQIDAAGRKFSHFDAGFGDDRCGTWPDPGVNNRLQSRQPIGHDENVKRWRTFVVALLATAALGGGYLYRHELGLIVARNPGADTGSDADPSLPLAARPARINWKAVNRSQDGFRVEMPVDIKEIQVPAYNENGGAEAVNMIFSNPDGATTFAVAWADNPPVATVSGRAVDKTLDAARDGALSRTQTSLVNESPNPPGGSRARNLTARNSGGGIMDTRLIYAGNRLYMLTAAFPSMSARREEDVTRFFTSFKASGSGTNTIPEGLPQAAPPAH